MAITTIDQFLSAGTEVYFIQAGENRSGNAAYGACTLFTETVGSAVSIGLMSIGSLGLAGTAVSDMRTGTFTIKNPAQNKTKYFIGCEGNNRRTHQFLSDLLWVNSGVTAAGTSFTINSVEFAPRDADGLSSGRNVRIALCPNDLSTTANFATGAYITYTNTENIGSRTGWLTHITTGISLTYDSMLPFSYQIGDIGVKSVQTLVIPSSAGQKCSLIAYREIASIGGISNDPNGPVSESVQTIGMPIVYSGASMFFTTYGISQNTQFDGYLKFIEG